MLNINDIDLLKTAALKRSYLEDIKVDKSKKIIVYNVSTPCGTVINKYLKAYDMNVHNASSNINEITEDTYAVIMDTGRDIESFKSLFQNMPYKDKINYIAVVHSKHKILIDKLNGLKHIVLKPVTLTRFKSIFTDINNISAKVQHTTSDSNERVALKGSILVVEDNPVNQKLLVIFLEKAGFNVTVASNGQEAVDIIKNNREFNVIFMDIHMPNMNGYEATEKIRRSDKMDALTVPIIAVTADAFKETEEKVLLCGMNGFISKPINFAKLSEAVKKALNSQLNTNERIMVWTKINNLD